MRRIDPGPRILLAVVAVLIAVLPALPGVAASPTAIYRVRFVADWSAATHPIGFPSGPHFSGLIGGTHNDQVEFWSSGSLASTGIKDMAELGSKVALTSEVNAAISAGDADSVISGGGINPSPGTVSVTFVADQDFPLMTLVAMIAPSPDWFVGVSGLSLMADGEWIDQEVIDLFGYDAGTDSGTGHESDDDPTAPPENIALLTGLSFGNGMPLGTFTVTRIGTGSAVATPSLGPAALGLLVAVLVGVTGWTLRRPPGDQA